uniref:SAM domain-containing protein n=1 Tax=Emiliania huxleyi TaxID=2903 RepID=A0A7S3WXC3_EMIHU
MRFSSPAASSAGRTRRANGPFHSFRFQSSIGSQPSGEPPPPPPPAALPAVRPPAASPPPTPPDPLAALLSTLSLEKWLPTLKANDIDDLEALSLLSLDDLDDLGLSLGGRRKLHAALHGQSVGASPRSARSSGASPRGSGATLPPAATQRAQAGGFEHLSAPNPFTAPDPFPRPDGGSPVPPSPMPQLDPFPPPPSAPPSAPPARPAPTELSPRQLSPTADFVMVERLISS